MWTGFLAAGLVIALGLGIVLLGVGILLDMTTPPIAGRAAKILRVTLDSPFGDPAHRPPERLLRDGFTQWPGGAAKTAATVLREDPRFSDVRLRQNSGGPLHGTVTLYGTVKTENDKWDARDHMWKILGNPPKGPKAIFNEITVVREVEHSRPYRWIHKDDRLP